MTTGPAAGFATTGIENHPGHASQKSHGRKGLSDEEALQRWSEIAHRSGNALGSVDLGLANVDEVDGSYEIDDPRGLLDKLSPEQRAQVGDALYTYATSTTSLAINKALRDGADVPPHMRREIDGLDAATEASKLGRDAVVHRGILDPREVFGDAWNDDDVTGLSWREDGYVSTTADPRMADWFGTAGNWSSESMEPGGENHGRAVVMTLAAPEGTGAVRLSEMGRGQAELLLERGLTLRVVQDEGLDEAGIRHIDVLVTGDQ